MDALEFERLKDLFFAALDQHHLEDCRQLLAQARASFTDPYRRHWLDYLEAILWVESSPPRWDQAERLLTALLDAEIAPNLRARVLLELGINADFQGDSPRSVAYYQCSLSLFERLGDALYQAKVLKNMGIAYTRGYELAQLDRTALEKAMACHYRSLRLCQELEGEAWLAATVQEAIGTVYKALGQWDQALGHYRHKAAVCRRLGRRYSLGLTMNNMGEIYQRKRIWNWATRCYRQALAIMREYGNVYEEADVLANLASLRWDQGQLDKALELYDQAISVVESMRAALTTEGARVGFLGTEIHVYEGKLMLCLHRHRSEEAFATLERAKSRAFVDLLGRQSLRPPHDVSAAWLEREQHARHQLDTLYQQEASERLERELDEVRRKIRLRDPEYASFQTVDPIDLGTVQERLPSDALLLEYFVTTDAAGVFLVSHDDLKVVSLPVTLSALRRAFASEQQTLTRLTPDRNNRLHHPWPLAELHRLLIKPIADELHSRRLLYIVPHGPLHYVPFHALYTERDGRRHYLLEDSAILYAPSATVLLEYCYSKTPSYQTDSLVLAYGGGLRYAEAEGQGVASILNGRFYSGSRARRSVVYGDLRHYRFLHCACHGHFRPDFPLSSGLMLADGTLDVLDILQRVRLNADLVVLSGCHTGQSALRRGDELIGLVRAFMYAGTPSVLVSLWQVDDLSTRILMEQFYRELTAGRQVNKAEALRCAQRYLMNLTETDVRSLLASYGLDEPVIERELTRLRWVNGAYQGAGAAEAHRPFAHPYYWAPFLLIGDRPRPWDEAVSQP